MGRGEKYPAILTMITKYEYKFKKPMNFQILIHYIQEALGISRKTAKDYADDLIKMKYITVDQNSLVTRSFNG